MVGVPGIDRSQSILAADVQRVINLPVGISDEPRGMVQTLQHVLQNATGSHYYIEEVL